MRTLLIILIAIVVIAVLLVLWGISVYNGLIDLRNRVKNGWSQIDVLLKQRSDLVPNLVETVKGYAGHESGTLTAVTQARSGAVQAAAASTPSSSQAVAQRAQAENKLSSALFNLMATVEAYPDLKANQNFMSLQNQLSDLEQKIAYARQFYNDVTQKYNTRIQTVPSNIIAGLFHFEQSQYFEAEPEAKQAPKVDFSNGASSSGQ
ncbi:LemA protein [Bombiscardovia apis]|uniref:LemA protein n=1 Tax=Bombiscardovia apis TaxID=2932182 RepID=A0ABM8BE88_9BIFI|nr:LemA family protein [Bombiscardovia apis]BDR55214.1 LemA protein [Bombiscardovia apis]